MRPQILLTYFQGKVKARHSPFLFGSRFAHYFVHLWYLTAGAHKKDGFSISCDLPHNELFKPHNWGLNERIKTMLRKSFHNFQHQLFDGSITKTLYRKLRATFILRLRWL